MSKETKGKKKKLIIFLLIAVVIIAAGGIFSYNWFAKEPGLPKETVSDSPADIPSPTSSHEPESEPETETETGIEDETPPIKIGRSKYPYPPLHYYDELNELVGFDIDLAQAASEIMGIEIEFLAVDWSEKDEVLKSGEVDMLWGGLSRSSVSDNIAAFTKPYIQSNIVLLMNEDRDYAKFEDLQGLQVCALNFTSAFDYLQAYRRDVIKPKRSFTPPEYQPLLSALSSGEYDCIVTDTSFAAFFCRTNDDAYKVSDSLIGASYVVAVRAEDTDFLVLLQDALDKLAANGTVDRLKEEWLSLPG